jgi:GntR family transcriptional regulator
MSISRDSAEPPWRQLEAILRHQIESGELAPGQRLPSILTLSQQYELATVTVRKALKALMEAGLIETTFGYGTFVRKPG